MFNVFPYKHTHTLTHRSLVQVLCSPVTLFSLIVYVLPLFYCTLITSFHLHFIYYCCYYFLFECKEHRFEYIFTTTTERESHTSIAEDKTLVRERASISCVCVRVKLCLCHVFTVSASTGVTLRSVVDCCLF